MSTTQRLSPALLLGALGVVYGDIGTSPIYTFRETLKAAGEAPAQGPVLGLLSLTFWTLMIVVTIKYVTFVLRADNDGEGGIMALLGLARAAEPDPRLAAVLLVAGLVGASLFCGDGMITPAISVLSAIEGLDVATPVFHPYIVPITIAVGAIVFTLMATWRRGRELILQRISEDNKPVVGFLAQTAPTLPRVRGTAIYLASRRDKIPYALADNVRHNKVLHERAALLTVVTERIPFAADGKRIEVEDVGSGFHRIVLHFGFAERPDVPTALLAHQERFPVDMDDTSFFIGRELPVPSLKPDFAFWREQLFAFITRNAVGAAACFNVRPKRVIELGVQVEL